MRGPTRGAEGRGAGDGAPSGSPRTSAPPLIELQHASVSFGAVQALAAGVYIVMNGQVFRSGEVVKDRVRNTFVRRR